MGGEVGGVSFRTGRYAYFSGIVRLLRLCYFFLELREGGTGERQLTACYLHARTRGHRLVSHTHTTPGHVPHDLQAPAVSTTIYRTVHMHTLALLTLLPLAAKTCALSLFALLVTTALRTRVLYATTCLAQRTRIGLLGAPPRLQVS